MSFNKNRNRIFIALALLSGIAFAGAAMYSTRPSAQLNNSSAGTASLGKIESTENDARYKSNESFVWYPTKQEQGIHVGDSVFAGENSKAEIKLDEGGDVSVGANSLVVFSKIKDQKLANLMQGNFKLSVKGEAQFAIRGKVTKIKNAGDGVNSDIQITTDKNNQTQLKVISGQAEVLVGDNPTPVIVTQDQVFDLPPPTPEEVAAAPVEEIVLPVAKPTLAAPTPERSGEARTYYWTLNDAYDVNSAGLSEKSPTTMAAKANFQVRWRAESSKELNAYVQLSSSPDFSNVKSFESASGAVEFKNLPIGNYFWRVSSDQETWSDAQNFSVSAAYTDEASGLRTAVDSLDLTAESSEAVGSWTTTSSGSVFAISKSNRYAAAETTYLESHKSRFEHTFSEAGTYFIKARALNSKNELGGWSETLKLKVNAPKKRKLASEEPAALTPKASAPLALAPTPEKPKVPPTPEVAVAELPPTRDAFVRDMWIWLGAGANFTTYTQTVPGFSDVTFGGIKTPAMMARTGFFVSDHYGFDFNYKSTPGEAKGSQTLAVTNGSYNWKSLAAELLYISEKVDDPKKRQLIWRGGFQQHQMPFIVPLTANSVDIRDVNLTALTLGVEYRKMLRQIRIETLFRYQQPLKSSANIGTSFEMRSRLSFDGSVGAAYEFKPNLYLGTYWYGQYHQYAFDYKNTGGTSFGGNQSLFFTNVDIRLGFEF